MFEFLMLLGFLAAGFSHLPPRRLQRADKAEKKSRATIRPRSGASLCLFSRVG